MDSNIGAQRRHDRRLIIALLATIISLICLGIYAAGVFWASARVLSSDSIWFKDVLEADGRLIVSWRQSRLTHCPWHGIRTERVGDELRVTFTASTLLWGELPRPFMPRGGEPRDVVHQGQTIYANVLELEGVRAVTTWDNARGKFIVLWPRKSPVKDVRLCDLAE